MEPTERDRERALQMSRQLEEHSGDGLCRCDRCVAVIATALADARSDGQRKELEAIESIIGEFGDNLKECAAIIGEHVDLALTALRRAARAALKEPQP